MTPLMQPAQCATPTMSLSLAYLHSSNVKCKLPGVCLVFFDSKWFMK